MSLTVVVWTPTGLVMAADSRTTITYTRDQKYGSKLSTTDILSDSTYKLVLLEKTRVGISTYGASHAGGLPVDAHLRAFEEERVTPEDRAPEVAEKLLAYFQEKFPGINLYFFVIGYREEDKLSVPYVYNVSVEKNTSTRVNVQPNGERWPGGVSRGGATDIVNRLIVSDRLPEFSLLPLQDAVDYAVFLIDVTSKVMRFEPGLETVGGPIDVLVITPTEGYFVQRKALHGSSR
jgi:hypothetical protein